MLDSVYLTLRLLWLEVSPRKGLLLEKRDSKVVLEPGVLGLLGGCAALQARGDPTRWELLLLHGAGRCAQELVVGWESTLKRTSYPKKDLGP